MSRAAARYSKSPVGAHYGTGAWLLQRLTAVVMAAYTIGFLACVLVQPPVTHADWKAIYAGPFMRVSTMFFVAALLYHAWVGMRDVVMDYVKSAGLRLVLQTGIGAALVLYLVWAGAILWGGR